MQITGTHINYHRICKRKLWLFSNHIQMEHTSELVEEGKLIHETAYPQRAEKYQEVEIDGIRIDYYDAKEKIVHEVKKSNKVENAHIWQTKYYLYILKKNGIEGARGILEYPKLRETREIELNEQDIFHLEAAQNDISEIIALEACPPRIKKTLCRNCSYHDFCWIAEESS